MAVSVEFTSDEHRLFRGMQKLIAQQNKMEGGFAKVGRAGQRAGRKTQDAFGSKAMSSMKAYAATLLSVSGAVGAVSRGYEVWLKNIREVASEARKAGSEVIAFAALQEGGMKAGRVRRAAGLGIRYGIADRGEAFNTVQALQSALGGDFEAGMKAAAAVFAATQVGIPLEKGRELEVLGAAQKQAPGQALRRAFVAGQLSAREPATLAGAAPGLTFFDDKETGFAAAAVLAGAVKPDELQTFVKAAGIALSKASAEGFQETFKRLGVAEGTQFERLRALAAAGITTPEQLKLAGLGELRQQQALGTLIPNIAEVGRLAAEIRKQAVPGILARQRVAVEAELPTTVLTREIAILGAKLKDAQAFGGPALDALRVDREQAIQGLALRRLGKERKLLFDLISEEGRSTWWDKWQYRIMEELFPAEFLRTRKTPRAPGPGWGVAAWERVEEEMQTIREELAQYGDDMRRSTESLDSATRNLNEAAGQMRGGPALRRPDED